MSLELSPQPTDSLVTLGLRFRLIDVREDYECHRRPIVSDYRLPLSRFDLSELHVSRDADLLVVCEQGQRSLKATQILRREGWHKAYSLRGGLSYLWPDHDDMAQAV